MKIYTASFWEPEVHGSGRKICIAPSAPRNLKEEAGYECEFIHDYLSPGDVYWNYHKSKKEADGDAELLKQAGETFVKDYQARLEEFKKDLQEKVENTGKTIEELIGFQEGDTLLSWERGGNTTFRTHTAECLRSLGYDVEER